MSRNFILFLLFLILSAAALPIAAQNVSPVGLMTTAEALSSGSSAHPLQISAGDLLDLSVFDTPELSTKLRVDEHGAVTLPIGGSLSLSGLTAGGGGLGIQKRFRSAGDLIEPH